MCDAYHTLLEVPDERILCRIFNGARDGRRVTPGRVKLMKTA